MHHQLSGLCQSILCKRNVEKGYSNRKSFTWSLRQSLIHLHIRLNCMHCDFDFFSDSLLISSVSLVCKLFFCDKNNGSMSIFFVLKFKLSFFLLRWWLLRFFDPSSAFLLKLIMKISKWKLNLACSVLYMTLVRLKKLMYIFSAHCFEEYKYI